MTGRERRNMGLRRRRQKHPDGWTCEWCGEVLAPKSPKDSHERSLTCTAKRNGKRARAGGLLTAEWNAPAILLAEWFGIKPVKVFDVYENRGWGRTSRGTRDYYPAWLVTTAGRDLHEYVVESAVNAASANTEAGTAHRYEVEEHVRQKTVQELIEAVRPLFNQALNDERARAALEAAYALGGPRAVMQLAKEVRDGAAA